LTIKRLLTGAVALPLLILLILKGTLFLFTCFVVLLSLLGLFEFYRMALPGRIGAGLTASLGGALLLLTLLTPFRTMFLFALTLLVILFGLIVLFTFNEVRSAASDAALLLMGFLYVPLLLGHLVLLRELPDGIPWIFLMMIIVMGGDTGAYYIGSSFGKRKLYPAVSPNKSVEGAMGGLVGSIVGAFIAKATFFSALTALDCLAIALVLGLLGQLGDLFESLLKRSFGVKDSGIIVPGHGGILDRLDSLLFAAPAAYYYARFIFYA
jgi:phosphatidate cytidylyltransferase